MKIKSENWEKEYLTMTEQGFHLVHLYDGNYWVDEDELRDIHFSEEADERISSEGWNS